MSDEVPEVLVWDCAACGQRGVLEIDRMGFIGGEPNVDIVTHYPSDHFFDMLFRSLRDD